MPLRPLKHIVKDIMDHCSKTIGNGRTSETQRTSVEQKQREFIYQTKIHESVIPSKIKNVKNQKCIVVSDNLMYTLAM